jgi:hypothetical protein
MWINPEHVVSLVPKITRDGVHHTLRVEVKLVGLPAFDAWLGAFDDAEAANTSWSAFLAMLQAPEDDAPSLDR